MSSGTVEWYRSSYGTDFDSSEIASPDIPVIPFVCRRPPLGALQKVLLRGAWELVSRGGSPPSWVMTGLEPT